MNFTTLCLGAGRNRCPEVSWPPGAFRWPVMVVVFILALVQPPAARAHGDIHLRILALTRQIEAATNNPARLYLERGELQCEHGEWKAASADYDRAAQLDPNLAGVDLCRAKLLADSGQLPAARAMFGRAIQRSPADGECFVGRARVLVKLGQRQAAIADFRRGLELQRQPQPDYVLALAQTLTAEGQVGDALRSLDDGIKKLGPILALQSYAVELELERKNTDAALARIETILAQVMRREDWLARRGDILIEAGRPAEARNSYEAALAAVNRLPGQLQRGPAMVKLQAHVNAALVRITNAPPSGQMK
jgi:tetratricopeptide (TPR) repeat protein